MKHPPTSTKLFDRADTNSPQVENNLDTRASISVELLTRSDTWKQEQTYIEDKGEADINSALPFFFEGNMTKDYAELVTVNVKRKGKSPLSAKSQQCQLDVDDAGSYKTLHVNATGWLITTGDRATCDGKWQKQKNDIGVVNEAEL